jgi:hypothetical protein
MSVWIVCAHCSLKHRPRPDGWCPRCKRPTADVAAATGPASDLPDIYDGRTLGGPHERAGKRSKSGSGAMWLSAMAFVVAALAGITYWMNRNLPDATIPLGGIPKLQAPALRVEDHPNERFWDAPQVAAPGPDGGQPAATPPARLEDHRDERFGDAPQVPAPGPEGGQPAAAQTLNRAWKEREQKRIDAMNAAQARANQRIWSEGKCAQARSNLTAISIVERAPRTFELRQRGKAVTEDEKVAARAESERFLQENCR